MIRTNELTFDDRGLVAAIVRDSATREVLTLAWMNRESLAKTIESGETWFWSRSRNELWHKGATSGNTQRVVAIRKDCDGDALLVDVIPAGPACHTGERSCFGDERPAGLDLAPLYAVLASRKQNAPEGSYSAKLFGSGRERIVKKIGEEATEVVIAGMGNERGRIVEETADLLFHLAVLLVDEGISLEEIGAELASREGKRRGS